MISSKTLLRLLLFLLAATLSIRCVESLTDTQNSTTPGIDIYSPKSGDTVKVGQTYINYKAADGSAGQGLAYYDVFVNGAFVKRTAQNTDGTNPNLYLIVDSALVGKTISYYIVVYNKQGKLKTSKTQDNIFVKDKEPKAPGKLFLSRVNDYEVLLHWDDSSYNEKGFELWRKDLGGNVDIDYRKIATLPANTITTRDQSLSPFVNYFYKVRAYNTTGYSLFSNEASTSGLPGGPWNLRSEAIGASSVRLRWIDFVTNEDGFLIQRTDPFTNNFQTIALTDANVTEYYDNSVQANTGYKYRVAYFVKQSNSSFSNEASVTTYYKDFSAPSNLTAVFYTGQGVSLEWVDNNKNIQQGTVIERKESLGSNSYVEIGTAAPDQTKFIDSTVQPGTLYVYRVRQILGTNTYTPYSNTVTINVPN
ncbi:MAG: fibronectin type III domain-containing protein [Bacteroidetes bacterium]|nr:fibronectin type III domain-containing protein [Bacteroidota bacterium]